VSPPTLAEFFAARLDEDEAAAKAWLPLGNPDAAQREHIARADPGRVLREVEAKRKRLALMADAQADMDRLLADKHAGRAEQAMAVGRARGATVAVKYDAEVYSDHPGYRAEWKP
jgi:Family of unknown function (DUF6221)